MLSPENHKIYRQFEILRNIAVSAVTGDAPSETANSALREAGRLVGLTAGSLIIWDDSGTTVLNVSFADSAKESEALKEIETEVFENLRKNRKMVSAYLTFGGEKPLSGFTLPIRISDRILGAVAGIQPMMGSLAREDMFLDALASALSVSFAAAGLFENKKEKQNMVRQERLKAIRETAATVNHEINNPLTAVLGNVQLLLMRSNELGPEFSRKLRIVEESALRIRDVTRKLMNLTGDSVTEYISGSQMIDLNDSENAE